MEEVQRPDGRGRGRVPDVGVVPRRRPAALVVLLPLRPGPGPPARAVGPREPRRRTGAPRRGSHALAGPALRLPRRALGRRGLPRRPARPRAVAARPGGRRPAAPPRLLPGRGGALGPGRAHRRPARRRIVVPAPLHAVPARPGPGRGPRGVRGDLRRGAAPVCVTPGGGGGPEPTGRPPVGRTRFAAAGHRPGRGGGPAPGRVLLRGPRVRRGGGRPGGRRQPRHPLHGGPPGPGPHGGALAEGRRIPPRHVGRHVPAPRPGLVRPGGAAVPAPHRRRRRHRPRAHHRGQRARLRRPGPAPLPGPGRPAHHPLPRLPPGSPRGPQARPRHGAGPARDRARRRSGRRRQ